MTFAQTKNIGLLALLCVLFMFAFLANRESQSFFNSVDVISHSHNVQHHKAMAMMDHLKSFEIEFEIYRGRRIVSQGEISSEIETLVATVAKDKFALVNGKESSDFQIISDHLKTAEAAWDQYTELVTLEDDPTSDTAIASIDVFFESVSETKMQLIKLLGSHGGSSSSLFFEKELQRMIVSLEGLMALFVSQNPVSIKDMHDPVHKLLEILSGRSFEHSETENDHSAHPEKDVQDQHGIQDHHDMQEQHDEHEMHDMHDMSMMGSPLSTDIDEDIVREIDESVKELEDLITRLYVTEDTPFVQQHLDVISLIASRIKMLELSLDSYSAATLMSINKSVDDLRSELNFLKKFRHVVTLIGIILALLISILLSKMLSKQVSAVSQGAQLIADGNLDHRIEVAQKDELGRLSSEFNIMADRLNDRELEKEKLMKALDHSAKNADAANKAKSDFLASMSHEIRTPINGVLGTTDLLLREKLTRSQKHLVETIHRSGFSLLGVINDILDFSKIESGNLKIEKSLFNLVTLVEDVAEMSAPAAHGKQLELNYILPPNLTENYLGDSLRLRQILTNVVSNAIKFTESGEVVITVSAVASRHDEVDVVFSIKDTGIGISEEATKNIFKAFSQADISTTRRYGGTGLGLSISKQLVELMAGTINVDSEVGCGSVFTIRLPLTIADNQLTEATPREYVGKYAAVVVSGNQASRESLKSHLDSLYVPTVLFESSKEAITHIQKYCVEDKNRRYLILVDCTLADISGSEFQNNFMDSCTNHSGLVWISLKKVNEDSLQRVSRLSMNGGYELVKPVRSSAVYNCLLDIGGEEVSLTNIDYDDSAVKTKITGRILLAEDHPTNQDIVMRMLHYLGCDVVIAADGKIAIDMLETEEFDLILMDCDMPVVDGIVATKCIRERERKLGSGSRIPIIALTANALQGDREKCLSAGMDDYLSKPISLDVLQEKLTSWLKPEDNRSTDSLQEKSEAKEGKPVLDMGVVDQILLLDDGSEEIFAEIIYGFEDNWAIDSLKLNNALENRNYEVVRKTAHRLKSASSTLGAARLSAVCDEIENRARTGDISADSFDLDSLSEEFSIAIFSFKKLLDKAA